MHRDSSIIHGLAPVGKLLLTLFVGGAVLTWSGRGWLALLAVGGCLLYLF